MRRRIDLSGRGLKGYDWTGTAVITVVAGALVAAAVFLPWANDKLNSAVNLSLTKPNGILGALQTRYGLPVLVAGLLVLVAGLLMIVLGPRRVSVVPGLLVFVSAFVVVALCKHTSRSMYDPVAPGLGLYIDTLVGVLLAPIGFAGAALGFLFRRRQLAEE